MIACLVICAILVSSAGAKQRFVETPATYQEVSSGEDVQLRCVVADKKGQCIWQKDRKPIGLYLGKYEWNDGRDGDCTLRIRKASLNFDDGFWECQITAANFTQQDALSAPSARLLVQVKPRKPSLEYGGALLSTSLTLREGQEAAISCVSRYGNPPALIKWFIGDKEAEPLKEQSNATEVDNTKTWAAHSVLRVRGSRQNHALPVKCLAFHPASSEPEITELKLDVQYSPEVRLETSPRILGADPEDLATFMKIRCIANSNPISRIKWYRNSSPISSDDPAGSTSDSRNGTFIESEIRFEPIKRENAGLYSCKAVNVIGESFPSNYTLAVQFGPKLKMTNLDESSDEVQRDATLGLPLEPFECEEFESNPPAIYQWMHLRGGIMENVDEPSQSRKLRLGKVTWSNEGEYRCKAYNFINGVRRERTSDTRFVLNVMGAPEIQPKPSSLDESISYAGESAHRLKLRFCSRPPPSHVSWEWGSSHIRAGEKIEHKYEAFPIEPIIENRTTTHCFWAKLDIRNVQKEDARIYRLIVESTKGRDETDLKLIVRDPTETRLFAAAAAVGLVLLILLVLVVVCTFFKARNPEKRKYQREVEEGSIATDTFYNTSANLDRQKIAQNAKSQAKTYARKTSPEGGLAIMYNYDEVMKQSRAISPEALEVRRAPAVLQPPTLV